MTAATNGSSSLTTSPEPAADHRLYVCRRCGACCCWPGDVRVSAEEIDRLAAFLGLAPRDFIARHAVLNAQRSGLCLAEQPNGHCVFFAAPNFCRVYPVRPRQCAALPLRYRRRALAAPT